MLDIFIGYDPVEDEAYKVLEKSLDQHSLLTAKPLKEENLRSQGLYWRNVDKRGQPYDLISNAPCSTEFSSSRFLTPILGQTGWALFLDCDMLFLCDPQEIMLHADSSKAVMVVKHNHPGAEDSKMCGMAQTVYNRKNWSSVMLFNCSHPANRRLSLRDVNERPGRDLHQLYWLHDDEIGELPVEWNWLVGVQDKPESPKIAHFTLGGPWFDDWEPAEHDDLWLKYAGRDKV